jgi:hypothetical protein
VTPLALAGQQLRGRGGDGLRALHDLLIELAARVDGVDEAPLLGPLAAKALGGGREHVGAVAPDAALVDEAGEAAGAGEHAEQRDLGQADGAVAVVLQVDLLAGEGELVAAAGAHAVAGGEVGLGAEQGGVLDLAAGLVGELAEVHLPRVRRLAEHVDVGAGAEHVVGARREQDDADLGVLEAQATDDVGELDVDAEVVGVQLELVAGSQAALGIDAHAQASDGAVVGDLPVAIAGGVPLELDGRMLLRRDVHHGSNLAVRPEFRSG